uniref:Uncharacterized protein n=1 Tax=Macaca nemestrina TaxID=9545 RepID=A0A2K6ASQ6_MACNE
MSSSLTSTQGGPMAGLFNFLIHENDLVQLFPPPKVFSASVPSFGPHNKSCEVTETSVVRHIFVMSKLRLGDSMSCSESLKCIDKLRLPSSTPGPGFYLGVIGMHLTDTAANLLCAKHSTNGCEKKKS